MRTITVGFSDGDTITTSINGTNEEIARHYLGNTFEAGSDTQHHVALCIHFHDTDERIGLRCKNIESGHIGMIREVKLVTEKIDDERDLQYIDLTLRDTKYDLEDVWVFDLNGNWIKTIGYPQPIAN
jgi:hypothetical protein